MQDGFDYNPPEGPLDCCAGMSRHGRLSQKAPPDKVAVSTTDSKKKASEPPVPVTAPRG